MFYCFDNLFKKYFLQRKQKNAFKYKKLTIHLTHKTNKKYYI